MGIGISASSAAHDPLSLNGYEATVGPNDCDHSGACDDAFRKVIRECVDYQTTNAVFLKDREQAPTACRINVVPGYEYRVRCPLYNGSYAYIQTPPVRVLFVILFHIVHMLHQAIDLSNIPFGITFGGPSSLVGSLPTINVDYVGNGCPAIGAWNSSNVQVTHINIDTQRLPFTYGSVAHISADKTSIVIKFPYADADHLVWDTQMYPW